jgi:Uma2 family endonuclease
MNEPFTMPPKRPVTQAAEGLPRWHWTVAELERIAEAGFFTEYDEFELLGGEMVPVSPEGRRHVMMIRIELAFRITELALAASGLMVAVEPQFNLSGDTYLKPDILVHPRSINTYDLRPADSLLLVEVADTSLRYDIKTKMPLYAQHGVPEYWVIHAATLMTTVHRRPSASGNVYAFVEEVSPDSQVVPSLVPELAVSLGALPLG